MTETELHYADESAQNYLKTHPCGDIAEKTATFLGIKEYYTTINTACSSAANAIIHGVVGGADALSVFTLNGFKSLMILSSTPCRPFDAERCGLNLGEGAGFLVLERREENNSYMLIVMMHIIKQPLRLMGRGLI